MPARPLGKAKTVVQDLAVGAALLPIIGDHQPGIAVALLYLAVVLTVISGAQYLIDGRRVREAVSPAVAACPSPPAGPPAFDLTGRKSEEIGVIGCVATSSR